MSCFNRADSDFGADSEVGDGGGEGEVEYARRPVKECFPRVLLFPKVPRLGGGREREPCLAENGSRGAAMRVLNRRKVGIRGRRAGGIARRFRSERFCLSGKLLEVASTAVPRATESPS